MKLKNKLATLEHKSTTVLPMPLMRKAVRRYAQLMTRCLFILLTVFLFTGCKIKRGTGQWNLNQTVGWKRVDPNDYTILFAQCNPTAMDSIDITNKEKFDEAVLKELELAHLGNRAENDDSTETDFHYVVSSDYKKAVVAIATVAKEFDIAQKVTVYKRDYTSAEKWTDKIIYPD